MYFLILLLRGKKLRVEWSEQYLPWLSSALVLQISPNPSAFCTALIACKGFYGQFEPQMAATAAGLRLTRGTKQRVMESTVTLPSDVQDETRAWLQLGQKWDRSRGNPTGTWILHGERQELQGVKQEEPHYWDLLPCGKSKKFGSPR